MAKNKFLSFINRHLIISNLVIIICVVFLLGWLTIVWFNHYTRHGEDLRIPDVKGMTLQEAKDLLQSQGFNVRIDSMYLLSSKPGIIMEQSPMANSLVKRGKTVVIRYVCYTPKMATIPKNFSNFSAHSAIEELRLLGMDVKIEYVPSAENGVLVSVTYKGRELRGGERIPMGSEIIVTVGERQSANVATNISNQASNAASTVSSEMQDNIFYEESDEGVEIEEEIVIPDVELSKPKPAPVAPVAPTPAVAPPPSLD